MKLTWHCDIFIKHFLLILSWVSSRNRNNIHSYVIAQSVRVSSVIFFGSSNAVRNLRNDFPTRPRQPTSKAKKRTVNPFSAIRFANSWNLIFRSHTETPFFPTTKSKNVINNSNSPPCRLLLLLSFGSCSWTLLLGSRTRKLVLTRSPSPPLLMSPTLEMQWRRRTKTMGTLLFSLPSILSTPRIQEQSCLWQEKRCHRWRKGRTARRRLSYRWSRNIEERSPRCRRPIICGEFKWEVYGCFRYCSSH